MRSHHPIVLALILIVALAATGSAQAPAVIGTEIFVTVDWNQINGCDPTGTATGNPGWDNVVLQDMSGTVYTVTFDSQTTTAQGTFGPIYPEGDYELEAIWLGSTFAPGFTNAHMHYQTAGGNPGGQENSHYNTATDNQGFRISRPDGQPFILRSLDYRDHTTDLVIGTSFTAYTDIATNFAHIGPTQGLICSDPNWNTLNFVSFDATEFLIDPSTSTVSFAGGVMSASGVVSGYRDQNGIVTQSAALDAVIGGGVTVTGNVIGNDFIGLTDIIIQQAVTQVSADPFNPANDSVSIQNQYSIAFTNGDAYELVGPLGAVPSILRDLEGGLGGSNVVTRSGMGSTVIDNFSAAVASETVSLVFRINGTTTPRLHSIARSYTPPPATPDFGFGADGSGGAQMGFVGYMPGSEVYNLVDLGPTQSIGNGALFGINLTPLVLFEIGTPIGSAPFHVTADTNGAFYWGIGPGSIPAGVVADAVSIEIEPGGTIGYVSEVIRVGF